MNRPNSQPAARQAIAPVPGEADSEPAHPVVLPHTGISVPHTRLTLRNLRSIPTSDGEAYSAELLLDGRPVGVIENTGTGGPTTWLPLDRNGFGHTQMHGFVAACRDEHGGPIAEEFVLAELFEETRTARDVTRYLKAGKAVVRTVSAITSDGAVAATFADAYYGVPAEWATRPGELAASMWRQRPDAYAIELWTGERWDALPEAGGTEPLQEDRHPPR
jgi:hypothetical protein